MGIHLCEGEGSTQKSLTNASIFFMKQEMKPSAVRQGLKGGKRGRMEKELK